MPLLQTVKLISAVNTRDLKYMFMFRVVASSSQAVAPAKYMDSCHRFFFHTRCALLYLCTQQVMQMQWSPLCLL